MEEEMDFDAEDFLGTLSEEEFKKISSAEIITSNNTIINNSLEAITNANLNVENTDLIISGDVNQLFLILPETKGLSRENCNKLKDIECFKKAYENEGKEINSTIIKIKKHFSELNKCTKDLLNYIQNVYNHHSNDAKEMIKPIITKKKGLDEIDEKKLSIEEKISLKSKKEEFSQNFEKYDKKLSDILKNMKKNFESIDSKIQTFTSTMESMATPINDLVEHINEIFGEFEDKSKTIIEILKNDTISKEENEEIISIFEDIKKYNPTIIDLLQKKENFLEDKNKDLVNKITECKNDSEKVKKINEEVTKSFKEFNQEAKDLISQINEIRTIFSLDEIKTAPLEISGIVVYDFENKFSEGAEALIQANKKIIADLSNLREYIAEENSKTISYVTLDLAFIMDITGSMSSYLQMAKDKIIGMIDNIKKNCGTVDVKLGFVGYRDYLDSNHEYLTVELNNNSKEVRDYISKVEVGGGGDCEDMPGGLNIALNFKWSGKSRFAVLIADVPCHGKKYHGLEGFDSHPNGDGKYNIDKIIEEFARKNISLLCLNITNKTINLYNNFVDYYQRGRKGNASASIYVDNFNKKPEELAIIIEKSAKDIYEKRHDNN